MRGEESPDSLLGLLRHHPGRGCRNPVSLPAKGASPGSPRDLQSHLREAISDATLVGAISLQSVGLGPPLSLRECGCGCGPVSCGIRLGTNGYCLKVSCFARLSLSLFTGLLESLN